MADDRDDPVPAGRRIHTRLFSHREANAFVPRLIEVFSSVRDDLAEGQRLVGELSELGYPPPGQGPVDPDPAAPVEVQRKQERLRDVAESVAGVFEELSELGIEVKSPDGLVDFRSRHDGQVVYLCWRYGETEVNHWHTIEAGFAGRKPIQDPEDFEGDYLQ